MIRFSLTLFAVLTLLTVPSLTRPAYAGGCAAPRLADSEAAALNLTPAQQQKLTALETASHTQARQFIGQIEQLRHKLSELYEAYALNVGDIRKANQDLNHVQGQLLDLRLSEQLQLHKILTPEQFTKLQTALHKHGFSEERHRHNPDGPSRHRDE